MRATVEIHLACVETSTLFLLWDQVTCDNVNQICAIMFPLDSPRCPTLQV